MTLFIGEKVGVIFDFGVVIDGLQVTFVVKAVKSVLVVLDMINEENAIQMVDFVHEGASEVAISFEADFSTVFEHGFDLYPVRATNQAINLRNREASLMFFDDFAVSFDNFRIDEGGEGVVFLIIKIIAHDNDALVYAHLGGSHSSGKLKGVCLFPV